MKHGFLEARQAVYDDEHISPKCLAAWMASDLAYLPHTVNQLQDAPILSIRLHSKRNADPKETDPEKRAARLRCSIHYRDWINAKLKRKKARKSALQKIAEEQKKTWEEHERNARRGCECNENSRFNPY
jgi:hypothetical protein